VETILYRFLENFPGQPENPFLVKTAKFLPAKISSQKYYFAMSAVIGIQSFRF